MFKNTIAHFCSFKKLICNQPVLSAFRVEKATQTLNFLPTGPPTIDPGMWFQSLAIVPVYLTPEDRIGIWALHLCAV